ncbi:MAG: hypothetical protein K6E47_14585 [Lachnospiraceae bacterium]|nr:hypothetical protein [Lachnospiraceae bacterium]
MDMENSPLKVYDLVTEDVNKLVSMGVDTLGSEQHASFAVYDRINKVMYEGRRSQDFSDEVLDMEVISWEVEPDLQDFNTIIVRIEAEMDLEQSE